MAAGHNARLDLLLALIPHWDCGRALKLIDIANRCLRYLKLTVKDEVDAIDIGNPLTVDFLASIEILRLHVVLDFLEHVGPELAEHAEAL